MIAQVIASTFIGAVGFAVWYFFPRIFACVALFAYMHATKQIPAENDPISDMFSFMIVLCLFLGFICDIINICNGAKSEKKNKAENPQGGS